MGTKMTTEEVEDLMKTVDTAGDGFLYLADVADVLCPPKK